jgi:hypothetical protein
LQLTCAILSVLSILAGTAGMVASFVFLSLSNMADITAGASGFVAGSILIGAGLVSLSYLSK